MTNSFDTSTFPSQDPTPKKKGGGFRKWGGIAVAVVIGLSIIGSCNSAASDTDIPAETVTVTTTTTKEAKTVTQTETVTTEVEVTPEEPTEEALEPMDVDVNADLGSDNDVDSPRRIASLPDTAPARVTTQAPAPAPAPAPAATYYANCSAVRAAGAAPLYAGSPGYSTKLDRDRDGIACE